MSTTSPRLIALGESMIAIGVGAGFELGAGVIAGAALGIVVVSALSWLTSLGQVGEALDTVPAVGACGGAALEVLRYREARVRVRHPELAA